MGFDRQAMVGGVEGLGERDEVEEGRGDGGGDGEVAPARAVVEGRGQHSEGRYAVEENRDSEPKKSHRATMLVYRAPIEPEAVFA